MPSCLYFGVQGPSARGGGSTRMQIEREADEAHVVAADANRDDVDCRVEGVELGRSQRR